MAKPRDAGDDHLLTPQNAAVVIIDVQPVQVSSIASRRKRELVCDIIALWRIAKFFEMPVVLSMVNIKTGRDQPTMHPFSDGRLTPVSKATNWNVRASAVSR